MILLKAYCNMQGRERKGELMLTEQQPELRKHHPTWQSRQPGNPAVVLVPFRDDTPRLWEVMEFQWCLVEPICPSDNNPQPVFPAPHAVNSMPFYFKKIQRTHWPSFLPPYSLCLLCPVQALAYGDHGVSIVLSSAVFMFVNIFPYCSYLPFCIP